MHTEAERVTKEIEALREVLGQEKLERYQALQSSLGQRRQIRELDQRLGDSDKPNGTQRERLVEPGSELPIPTEGYRALKSARAGR